VTDEQTDHATPSVRMGRIYVVLRCGLINTIIKTTSVCDGDARSVGGGRDWLAGDTDELAGWSVAVGVVQVTVFALHTGLAGRGDGYQCGLVLVIHFSLARGAKYCTAMSVSVCLFVSVCPLEYLTTTMPKLTKLSVHINYGHGLFLV